MKILNRNNNLFGHFLRNIEKTNNNNNLSQSVEKDTGLKVNPLYYQAYQNISFGNKNAKNHLASEMPYNYFISRSNKGIEKIISKITLLPDNEHLLDIDNDVIKKYLVNHNKVDENLLKHFISIYTKILQIDIENEKKEFDFISQIAEETNEADKNSNIILLNPLSELRHAVISTLSDDKDNFVKSFFDSISNDKLKHKVAEDLKNFKVPFEYLQQNAYKKTCIMFELSETNNGYDFSDFDKKKKIIDHIMTIKDSYKGDNLGSDYISEIKLPDGSIDYDFAENLYQLIRNTNVYTAEKMVSHHSFLLRFLSKIDEENKDKVIKGILNFSRVYEVNDSDTYFEQAFINSFNPKTNKFDEKAYNVLISIIPEIDVELRDMDVETPEKLDEYMISGINIIKGYFKEIRNPQNGCIKDEYVSLTEYLNK